MAYPKARLQRVDGGYIVEIDTTRGTEIAVSESLCGALLVIAKGLRTEEDGIFDRLVLLSGNAPSGMRSED